MLKNQKIAFIGAGNMAEALMAGLLQSGTVKSSSILATDVSQDRLNFLKGKYHVHVEADNIEAIKWATIIILAVKPQVLPHVLRQVKKGLKKSQLVISIAAGFPLSKILGALSSSASVIRAMPNTPCLVQQGATALATGKTITDNQLHVAQEIFEASGKVVIVEETLMDAVTGLSGSGPAFVYVIIEALADGGVRMGLPRHIAQTLATQTVLGTANLVSISGEHPGLLKDRVTSPGGTTIAGLHELEKGGVRATFMSAVEAATKRSQELGS